MNDVYKFLLFLTIFLATAIGGYFVFRFLNEKIKGENSGWALLGYILLLIAVNAILLVGGLFILIKVYSFLTNEE